MIGRAVIALTLTPPQAQHADPLHIAGGHAACNAPVAHDKRRALHPRRACPMHPAALRKNCRFAEHPDHGSLSSGAGRCRYSNALVCAV